MLKRTLKCVENFITEKLNFNILNRASSLNTMMYHT
jgi:hypothetical protein